MKPMAHARSAWWLWIEPYAPRKPRHRLASLGNPKKKKCSLLFWFARARFFLKKERTFFFLGFCPPSIRAVRGASIRTRQSGNLFFGEKGFSALPRLLYRPQEGFGEECGRDSFSLQKVSRAIIYITAESNNQETKVRTIKIRENKTTNLNRFSWRKNREPIIVPMRVKQLAIVIFATVEKRLSVKSNKLAK